jgi:uncharacterized protein YfaT (DUF1175 family)
MRPLVTLTLLSLLVIISNTACRRTSVEAHAKNVAPAAPVTSPWNDGDRDGLPDGAELRSYNDRENFRHWFTAIAEWQFYHLSESWSAEQRDCAGLVRFSMREALRTHDLNWFPRMGKGFEPPAPDVRAFNLERNPLGERLFRKRTGGFEESDLTDGTFNEFADARTLKDFNCDFVSRERGQAQAGDLLFFYQPSAQKYPFHVMLFLGKASVDGADGENGDDWVVYHTGASTPTMNASASASTPNTTHANTSNANAGASMPDAGVVKKVRLSTLDEHPDARWRPLLSNRNFLGFYRLKILQ